MRGFEFLDYIFAKYQMQIIHYSETNNCKLLIKSIPTTVNQYFLIFKDYMYILVAPQEDALKDMLR